MLTRKNSKLVDRTHRNVTGSTTHPTRTALSSNTGRHSKRPMSNRQIHGMITHQMLCFIAVFTSACHWSLSTAIWNQPTPSQPDYKIPLNLLNLPVTWCTNSLTYNNCTFCPHCIYVFCIYLRTNSDLCHLQHKLIGFYNREEKCLLRGTNWVFKYSSLRFVFKGLKWCIICRLEFEIQICNLQGPPFFPFDRMAWIGSVNLAMTCK